MTTPIVRIITPKSRITALWCICLVSLVLAMVLAPPVQAEDVVQGNLPVFRHIDRLAKIPQGVNARVVRLLMDQDFPPFTYEAADGKAAGVSVDLALAACGELKLTCTVVPKKFDELLPALQNNEGDMIISGLKIDETVLKNSAMTRPYFWSLGRFAVAMASQLRTSDVRSLAGKRIGYVSNTNHAAWLEKYYARSTLTGFASEADMFSALRTGAVDLLFGDDLRVVYWLAGSASNGCCKTLDGAYVDRNFFSRNLAFLARREDQSLVQGFDYALDRLQEKGVASQVFLRYLPNGLW